MFVQQLFCPDKVTSLPARQHSYDTLDVASNEMERLLNEMSASVKTMLRRDSISSLSSSLMGSSGQTLSGEQVRAQYTCREGIDRCDVSRRSILSARCSCSKMLRCGLVLIVDTTYHTLNEQAHNQPRPHTEGEELRDRAQGRICKPTSDRYTPASAAFVCCGAHKNVMQVECRRNQSAYV